MSEELSSLKESEKETAVTESRKGPEWMGGLLLIGIGVVFLATNYFNFTLFNNWWALFIMIPAVITLSSAWQKYQRHGHFNDEVRGSLIGGLFITTVALIFLFDLDWGLVWPVFIIIAGLGALMGGLGRRDG